MGSGVGAELDVKRPDGLVLQDSPLLLRMPPAVEAGVRARV